MHVSRGLRKALLLIASGTLLAANNCLPQNYFADLAGNVITTTFVEVIANAVGAAFNAGAGA